MKKLVLILSILGLMCGCGGGGGGGQSTPPAISVSLAPATQTTIDQGQTLNFTATVANDSSSKGVTWSVSGTGCTGSCLRDLHKHRSNHGDLQCSDTRLLQFDGVGKSDFCCRHDQIGVLERRRYPAAEHHDDIAAQRHRGHSLQRDFTGHRRCGDAHLERRDRPRCLRAVTQLHQRRDYGHAHRLGSFDLHGEGDRFVGGAGRAALGDNNSSASRSNPAVDHHHDVVADRCGGYGLQRLGRGCRRHDALHLQHYWRHVPGVGDTQPSTGAITGMPTAAGTSTFTVT